MKTALALLAAGCATGPRIAGAAGPGSAGPGSGQFNREEMMKQFDANRDGQLDETERAAMRKKTGGRSRGGSTNATPNQAGPPNGSR